MRFGKFMYKILGKILKWFSAKASVHSFKIMHFWKYRLCLFVSRTTLYPEVWFKLKEVLRSCSQKSETFPLHKTFSPDKG